MKNIKIYYFNMFFYIVKKYINLYVCVNYNFKFIFYNFIFFRKKFFINVLFLKKKPKLKLYEY
ncbi:hypothetical protein [Candidatus Carsonella ruddii]|uniref:Uncharacterized protein n=1 Tax=Candidatus Carsonella ruddii PC isolate NHV TaxID=1202540 RepID=J3TWK5_CARRU|nr:hypothetical protein [Candidatus Carsonella ruddii]AFP84350.1 hypothetical protein A357_0150 [Candidatus Carsonella ruddii PC isolate NHV]